MTYVKTLLTIGILAAVTNEGQMDDWLAGLNENLNKLQHQIQESVQNIQTDVQRTVQKSLAHVDQITSRVNEDVEEAVRKGGKGGGGHSTIITGINSGTVVMNSPGSSRTITSGSLPDGKPFWYDVEDKVIGRNLYHTERYYNNSDKGIEVIAYTVNLDDPKAKPVPINTGA
ncbi:hypothetical protein KPH14_008288 [Odynerus spinipes]|uniref:Uncharacterized protein n=1 Tax=Odynerus spinipes TaxID=1348599 RepID=A0AAD9RGM6_9HYME|nr:hypothetical protein KPH14_008288 [Odynerus spinipes]